MLEEKLVDWSWLAPVSSPYTVAVSESLWMWMLQLADKIRSLGGYFFVELPRGSPAWSLRVTQLFLRCECARKYVVDMCAYNEGVLTSPRAQKSN